MRRTFSSEIVISDAFQSTNLEVFQTLVTQDFSFLSYSMFCLPKACFPRGFTGLCCVPSGTSPDGDASFCVISY